MTAVIEALMRQSIDYAGVFPPARLAAARAIHEYREFRRGQHGWMVGPLVMPSDQLGERGIDTSLPLAVVMRECSVAAVDAVARAGASLTIVTVEFPPVPREVLPQLLRAAPTDCRRFVEVPPNDHMETTLDRLAGAGAFAKIRTGGVSESSFPPAEAVCRFVRACVARRLPWKATAGLHHAVTGEYPLTYDAKSPTASMFGFLNLHTAVTLMSIGVSESEVIAVLTDPSPEAVVLEGDGMRWRDYWLSIEDIEATRRLFLSFGSCSVSEPIADLQRMGLL